MNSWKIVNEEVVRSLLREDNSSKYAIDAHHRQIEEILNLNEAPELKSLDISFNEIQILHGLDGVPQLKELKAYNNQLSDISNLLFATKLEVLLLGNNKLRGLDPAFEALKSLKTLSLNGNLLREVRFLSKCKLLTHLNLSRNQLSGTCIEGLQGLSNLHVLDLSSNAFHNLGNLRSLRKLEELDVSNNKLTTLQGLHGLQDLMILRANQNKIENIELPNEANITELSLSHNPISNVDGLKKMLKLEILDIRNCRVRGIANISCLAKLKHLEDLMVSGNPCYLSEKYYVDICQVFPFLVTLDNAPMSAILISPENYAKPGNNNLHNHRPSTPSTIAALCPSRQTTLSNHSDIKPVFATPSLRAGPQVQMLQQEEMQNKYRTFRGEIQSLRRTIANLTAAATEDIVPSKTKDEDVSSSIRKSSLLKRHSQSIGTDSV